MVYEKIKRFLKKGYIRRKAYLQNMPEVSYQLSFNDISLTIYKQDIFGSNDKRSIDWKAIKYVFAYKQDFYIGDCICLYLGESSSKGTVVHEDMEGWDELIKYLPDYLAGALDEKLWLQEVVFPKCATNSTLVYKAPEYPDAEIQRMIEGESDKRSKSFRFLMDILLYLCSFLPWALCFFSSIINNWHIRFLLNILFWLGIILILPSIIILAKAIICLLDWIKFSQSPTLVEGVLTTMIFMVLWGLYGAAMIVSLSVL